MFYYLSGDRKPTNHRTSQQQVEIGCGKDKIKLTEVELKPRTSVTFEV